MVYYDDSVKKAVLKGAIPKKIFKRINNAFVSLDVTNDLGLFDIKKLKSSRRRTYFRLRKGRYRAIFYKEDGDYFVISIAKREEVYDQWE